MALKPRKPADGPKDLGTSHVHVRPMELSDFEFIQQLASLQPTFTVPPTFVLWLIMRIKGAICIIAEHTSRGPLAYLLAVPVTGPEESIFIWQLATRDGRQSKAATQALLTRFRALVAECGIKRVVFSTIPNSASYRMIRRYAWKLASLVPTKIGTLPHFLGKSESEFVLKLEDE